MEIRSEIHIHAAAAAAWQRFTRMEEWPRWNRQVLDTSWMGDKRWEEGAVFRLRHRTLLGLTVTSTAVLRMVSPGSVAVWERQGGLLQVVFSASFREELGGCRLAARHMYHGPLAALLSLIRSRQQHLLEQGMASFKEYVEGSPR